MTPIRGDAAGKVLDLINQDEIVELTKALVRIPSFVAEETPAARWVANYLSSRGYEVELQEVDRGWFQAIATLRGTGGGRSLMFNGHLDINPLATGWRRDPFDPWVEGNRLYGAGVRNMKAGVASMIHAAEAVRRSGVSRRGDIVVACVVGELQGGPGTVHMLKRGLRTDAAVVTEPYGAHHVVIKHGGKIEFALHVKGRHPAGDDLVGVNAIYKMTRAIEALRATRLTHTPWDVPGLPEVNIGSLIGGRGEAYDLRSAGRNSDLCTAFVAVSTVPGMTVASVREDLERVLGRLGRDDPDFAYDLVEPIDRRFNAWREHFPPVDLPADAEIVQTIAANYRQVTGMELKGIGLPPNPATYKFGDDDGHIFAAGIPVCVYGPSGGTYGEDFAFIDEMVLCSKVLALTALHYCL